RRSTPFLTLEEHRRSRSQKPERRQGTKPAGACQLLQSLTGRAVGDLIVILQERDELLGRQSTRWAAAELLLPRVPLSLVQVPAFCGRDQFLRAALILAVIVFGLSGGGDAARVMEVVVPRAVQAIASPFDLCEESR